MTELAYALDSWNTNVVIQKKMPPRNEKGLKAYTKNFGELAKEFGLSNIEFDDVIDAYRSLPYSLPEFKNFPIPESVEPLIEKIDQKTSAIAEILDYHIKHGKPKVIYKERHPYLQHTKVLLAYRDVGLELFDKSKRLNHLFPSVAVLWGCLLVGEIRFMLSDSQTTDHIFGNALPHTGLSKRDINYRVDIALDHLEGKITNNTKSALEVGIEPYLILWQEIKSRANNKKKKEKLESSERLIQRIKQLNRGVKNDGYSSYYWMHEGSVKRTAKNAPLTITGETNRHE